VRKAVVERFFAGSDDVRGSFEVGFADFEVNNVPSFRFKGARTHQHIERGLNEEPRHPFS
jgi:hypothetical protein